MVVPSGRDPQSGPTKTVNVKTNSGSPTRRVERKRVETNQTSRRDTLREDNVRTRTLPRLSGNRDRQVSIAGMAEDGTKSTRPCTPSSGNAETCAKLRGTSQREMASARDRGEASPPRRTVASVSQRRTVAPKKRKAGAGLHDQRTAPAGSAEDDSKADDMRVRKRKWSQGISSKAHDIKLLTDMCIRRGKNAD